MDPTIPTIKTGSTPAPVRTEASHNEYNQNIDQQRELRKRRLQLRRLRQPSKRQEEQQRNDVGEQLGGTQQNDDPKPSKDCIDDNDVELKYVFIAIGCVSLCLTLALGVLLHVILIDGDRFRHHSVVMVNNNPRTQNFDSTSTNYFPALERSRIYTIPNSLDHIGDKSDDYALLRKMWDEAKLQRALSKIEIERDDVSSGLLLKRQLEKDSLEAMREKRSILYDSIRPMNIGNANNQHSRHQQEKLGYDIFNCPETPPNDYPVDFPTERLIRHWPLTQSMPNFYDDDDDDGDAESSANENRKPDDGTPRSYFSLCVFDYEKEYKTILRYRLAEVPFVVRNDPEVAATVERWSNDEYRSHLFGSNQVSHRAEEARTNQFLFWRPDKNNRSEDGSQSRTLSQESKKKESNPTKLIRMTYLEWQRKAEQIEDILRQSNVNEGIANISPYPIMKYPTNTTFHYYRLIGCGETGPTGECDKQVPTSEYLFDELPFFQPRQSQLYLVQPHLQRGIHCRLGMPGIFAQTHFDASRNAIVVLGGVRRYILSHPKFCRHLNLYPPDHPSARHSKVDWSRVAAGTSDQNKSKNLNTSYALLDGARSLEVVLQAGDVLYLPTNWFHMIVSLTTTYQCNTRSGRSEHYDSYMDECGFEGVNRGATRQELSRRYTSRTIHHDDDGL